MKTTLTTILFLASVPYCRAQTEVNVNIVNLLFFEASGGVEKGINENISVGGFAGYFYGLPNNPNNDFLPIAQNEGENKYFFIGPEVKYYIFPKGVLDRFFVGGYAKYSLGKAVSSQTNSNNQSISSSYNKAALGISIGVKWVTENNFIFGIFGGVDRNFVSQYENEEYLNYLSGGTDGNYFNHRIGAHIGYRFDN